MGRFVVFFLLGLLSPNALGIDAQIRNHGCYNEIRAVLNRWEPKRVWRLEDAGPVRIHRTRTAETGTWIESHRYPSGKLELVHLVGNEITRLVWEPGSCTPKSEREVMSYDQVRLKENFGDEALGRVLKENRAGIIYAWSPHMPLSVDGRYRVEKAASQLKLKVFTILDPHADGTMAKAVATRKRWDDSTLRRMESIELFNRGMGNHYPVMVVFANGNIVGPVFPGVKEESVYFKFISDHLASK